MVASPVAIKPSSVVAQAAAAKAKAASVDG